MPLLSPFFRLPGPRGRRRVRKRRMCLQLMLLAILLLLILPLYIIYRPPGVVIGQLQGRFPQVLFRVATSQKVVALTIDDAPTEYTRDIVAILEANGASATFFTIGGQVAGREDVLVDILRAGSELGNHAMHDEPSISLATDVLHAEIRQVDGLIDRAYEQAGRNRTAHYFRPGSGVFSSRILDLVSAAGHETVLGSVFPHDPIVSSWRVNAWHILSSVAPGAVIICHDRRAWTVPMLRHVVPALRLQGYEVVSLSRLLQVAAREPP